MLLPCDVAASRGGHGRGMGQAKLLRLLEGEEQRTRRQRPHKKTIKRRKGRLREWGSGDAGRARCGAVKRFQAAIGRARASTARLAPCIE